MCGHFATMTVWTHVWDMVFGRRHPDKFDCLEACLVCFSCVDQWIHHNSIGLGWGWWCTECRDCVTSSGRRKVYLDLCVMKSRNAVIYAVGWSTILYWRVGWEGSSGWSLSRVTPKVGLVGVRGWLLHKTNMHDCTINITNVKLHKCNMVSRYLNCNDLIHNPQHDLMIVN